MRGQKSQQGLFFKLGLEQFKKNQAPDCFSRVSELPAFQNPSEVRDEGQDRLFVPTEQRQRR
jgi:hypothetical protein